MATEGAGTLATGSVVLAATSAGMDGTGVLFAFANAAAFGFGSRPLLVVHGFLNMALSKIAVVLLARVLHELLAGLH